MLSLLSLIFFSVDAQACGGFFCNNEAPVDQTGEDIVFKIDRERKQVTAHIQITYQGPSNEFAWIVPVANQPVLEVSTPELFTQLEMATRAQFNTSFQVIGECEYGMYVDAEAGATYSSFDSSSTPYPAANGVQVLDEAVVGPYDTVTLAATSSEALIDWLQDNGYDLPDSLSTALDPYIANDANFVALKLSKDSDTGDMLPLAMTYDGEKAVIPIQLTAVAAQPDMRLRVYVLGDYRAVPESYLHVTINEATINWFNPWEPMYEEAITKAADEAGGHAFATDFAGSSASLAGALFQTSLSDTVNSLRLADGPVNAMNLIMQSGLSGNANLLTELEDLFGVSDESLAEFGLNSQSFFNCMDCYPEVVDSLDFNADDFADAFDEALVQPRKMAQDLVDSSLHITRLTSSLSPVEMTVDPVFVLNKDMDQDISKEHNATVFYDCTEEGTQYHTAPRKLVLSDERVINVPSQQWFWDEGTSEWDYLEGLRNVFAMTVEETGATGAAKVIFDYGADSKEEVNSFNGVAEGLEAEGELNSEGCGCSSTGSSTSFVLLVGLLGLLGRRRSA